MKVKAVKLARGIGLLIFMEPSIFTTIRLLQDLFQLSRPDYGTRLITPTFAQRSRFSIAIVSSKNWTLKCQCVERRKFIVKLTRRAQLNVNAMP
jgi:hypothetical protein